MALACQLFASDSNFDPSLPGLSCEALSHLRYCVSERLDIIVKTDYSPMQTTARNSRIYGDENS